jgi:hypothetical protein
MRRQLIRPVLLSLILACGRPPSDGAAIVTSITGRVLDASNGMPLVSAIVTTEPFVKQVFTNQEGQYTIDTGISVGVDYRVLASKTGYVTNSVSLMATEGVNTVADISVTKAGALLSLSTTSVTIAAGDSAATFRIENNGDKTQPLTYNLTASAEWIAMLSSTSGSVLSTPTVVTVTIDRSKLPTGTGMVQSNIDVATNGGSGTVQISVMR